MNSGGKTATVVTGVPGAGAWAYLILSQMAGEEPGKGALWRAPWDVRRETDSWIVVRETDEALEDVEDALEALSAAFGRPPDAAAPAFLGEDPRRRLASLERLHQGTRIILATPSGLDSPAPTPTDFSSARKVMRIGDTISLGRIVESLAGAGYQRTDYVESPGEFAVRGQVVDFFPLEPLRAVRLLFNENVVESVRSFDPQTQSGGDFLDEARLTPVSLDLSSSLTQSSPRIGREGEGVKGGTIFDWLTGSLGKSPQEGVWLIEEGSKARPPSGRSVVIGAGGESSADFGARPAPRFQGNLDLAVREMRQWKQSGYTILLFSLNRGEDERIQELLEGKLPEGTCQFLTGPVRSGFVLPRSKLAVATTSEIFDRTYRPSRPWLRFDAPVQERTRLADLRPGDYVVHQQYGIARYGGIQPVETRGRELDSHDRGMQDCLLLEYRNSDKVYVPMTEFQLVQKFTGAEGHRPRLSSLDTRNWEDVQARVREGVRELAEEILKMQARRAARPGYAFPPDSHMEVEFAEAFPYEETPDQRRAIEEVKADLMSPHPMDRVVVGDVGFGKTEVAMRACLKCVSGMKQAAVLVPTTILADQHYRTFTARFKEYPVRIEMLSRFLSVPVERRVIEDLAAGKVDILIGTHRLFSSDIRFKDLGLLVIDEEHRFGVKHKEALKKLKTDVDVLSLSATPIPRTLYQGLSGLRPLSLIQSAPVGRQPIVTTVRPWSETEVVSAIQSEIGRGGQAYYVYNKVRSLPEKMSQLKALMPTVRFGFAHGQMRSDALEKTMWDFFNRKFDVLVASSIIESGLDIAAVNTLLIEDAHEFGLSQLYQLRGRIGRERRKAYCHLFYPPGMKDVESLPEEGRRRLTALRELASLGSGFRLAMRDLEIRGAGDLLGARQHGFINMVGVEYYSQLLEGEIANLKGQSAASKPVPVQLDLGISAYLPQDYLPGEHERLSFYKRLISARSSELPALRRELEDLSGPLPGPAAALFDLLAVRRLAAVAGVREASRRGDTVEIRFRPDAVVGPEALQSWNASYAGRVEFVRDAEGDGIRVRTSGAIDPLRWLEAFLEPLSK